MPVLFWHQVRKDRNGILQKTSGKKSLVMEKKLKVLALGLKLKKRKRVNQTLKYCLRDMDNAI
jgi:hypothetical protein